MIGKTISHYKILEKLGEGGMGVVYKAEDTRLGRAVALKFLPPELTRDATAKERFINEARAASALDHPNICTIHEVAETDDGQTFIAMAYYDGESLDRRIARGPLPLDEALDIALQTAQGLAKAHARGIVHRDIKPANILVTTDGLVKIVDFGLAKLAGAKLTRTGATLGTAQYMSPEQARGEDVDARSDIFSLGAVLYEMLTGKHAFPGEYAQSTLYAIMNEEPAPVTSLRSGVPMEFERIVAKCLAKKPPDRYQHDDDLIVDLREASKMAALAAAVPTRYAPGGGPPAPARKRWRARPGFWIALAVLVVAVAVIVFAKMASRQAAPVQKSVAVLPFKNMSDSPQDEYFSDGMTEDIIAQLSKIADLKVISRTSVMPYKSSSKRIPEIGKELGVGAILEGSVRRAGERVRIVAQLIDARNEGHLWADTYDAQMTQIFAIQSDVAQKIAAALKATLLPDERKRIGKSPTSNLTAYDYYLKGRAYYYQYSRTDNESAIVLFKEALALDPTYALAYAGLGDAYAQRIDRYGGSQTSLDSARASSEKAIAIDPALAEGYKALALVYEITGRFDKSLADNRKALELNPNYTPALANIGWLNMYQGNLAESIELMRRSLATDPRTGFNHVSLAYAYLCLQDYASARKELQAALELQPNIITGHLGSVWLAEAEGRTGDASRELERALAIDPRDVMALISAGDLALYVGDLNKARVYYESAIGADSLFIPMTSQRSPVLSIAYILSKTGSRSDALRLLNSLEKRCVEQIDQGNMFCQIRYNLACLHAVRGDTTGAYEWLQKAIDGGWRLNKLAAIDPPLESLRGHARFKDMMARVQAMVDEQRRLLAEMDARGAGSGQ